MTGQAPDAPVPPAAVYTAAVSMKAAAVIATRTGTAYMITR